MIGFKIWINDEEVVFVAATKTPIVLIEQNESSGEYALTVTGSNKRSFLHWNERPLKNGDQIKIKVENMDKTTPPDLIRSIDMQTMKESYEILKKELTEKNLL